jgi:hypothetical protein
VRWPKALAFAWLGAIAFVAANERVQRRRLARLTKAELYERRARSICPDARR